MKAKDVKPGMIVAWQPKYGTGTYKVRIVGPGWTKGYAFSYQGPKSEKGWIVEIIDGKGLGNSASHRTAEGEPCATNRYLLGDWDEYEAARREAQLKAQQHAEEQQARWDAEALALRELDKVAIDIGYDPNLLRWNRNPVELLDLLRKVQSTTYQWVANDLVAYRDTKQPHRSPRDDGWRRGVEDSATRIRSYKH